MSVVLPPSRQFENPQSILDTFANQKHWQVLGQSHQQRPIYFRYLPAKDSFSDSGTATILFIGGVHGNENEGIAFAVDFCKEFALGDENQLPYNLLLLPIINPDGFINYQRQNGRGVDLNRNLPTKDFSVEYSEQKYFPGEGANSETENQLLTKIIDDYKIDFIISLHSWKPMVNINGPAKTIAQAFYDALPAHERQGETMVVADDIGYPTPGSLGTYAGFEKQIPTITLEFCRGEELEGIYPRFREALLTAFGAIEEA